jgi:hypothetical protein
MVHCLTEIWRNRGADPMGSPIIMKSPADEGFYQTIHPADARQQFNMSLGLVTALALIAATIGLTAGFGPLHRDSSAVRQARIVVQAPQPVHLMQAQRDVSPGG